ncbi:hypothetical protein PG999_012987 [Apiospora kogelbergensis]|uniref:Uncharacterized protein n=1 Tax=Apiospora kogelbergensis TaxID=1337665 RepID=A0AAW0QPW4_9PEZI
MKSQASLEKHLRQIHRAATFADNVEARNNGEGKEEEYAALGEKQEGRKMELADIKQKLNTILVESMNNSKEEVIEAIKNLGKSVDI